MDSNSHVLSYEKLLERFSQLAKLVVLVPIRILIILKEDLNLVIHFVPNVVTADAG